MKLRDKKIGTKCIETNCRERIVYGPDCKGKKFSWDEFLGTNYRGKSVTERNEWSPLEDLLPNECC